MRCIYGALQNKYACVSNILLTFRDSFDDFIDMYICKYISKHHCISYIFKYTLVYSYSVLLRLKEHLSIETLEADLDQHQKETHVKG